ncbi:MAG: hypothetical protein ACYCU7_18580 [Acidimicrobiales bacterium]
MTICSEDIDIIKFLQQASKSLEKQEEKARNRAERLRTIVREIEDFMLDEEVSAQITEHLPNLAPKKTLISSMKNRPNRTRSIRAQIFEAMRNVNGTDVSAADIAALTELTQDQARWGLRGLEKAGMVVRTVPGRFRFNKSVESTPKSPREFTRTNVRPIQGRARSESSENEIPLNARIMEVLLADPNRIWSRVELTARLLELGWKTTAKCPADAVAAAIATLRDRGLVDSPARGFYRARHVA